MAGYRPARECSQELLRGSRSGIERRGRLGSSERVVDLLVEEKKSCLHQQGIDVLRFPGYHDVNLAVCLRGLVILVVQGGEADRGTAETVFSFGKGCQQGSGVARSPGRQIVVAERQPRLRVRPCGDGPSGASALYVHIVSGLALLNGHVVGDQRGGEAHFASRPVD